MQCQRRVSRSKRYEGARCKEKDVLAKGQVVKRSKIKFEEIISYENCVSAIKNAAKNKVKIRLRKGTYVKSLAQRIMEHADEYAIKLQNFLIKLNDGEEHLHQGLVETINNDGTRNKQRDLCKPRFFPDQCAHWAIMQVVRPVLERGYDKYSCASIMGRGVHYAKENVERALKDNRHTKYCAQYDVRGFYKNVDKSILYNLLQNRIKDTRVLTLLHEIIYSHTGDGLPLGYYTSGILANYYLTFLDRFMHEQLHTDYYFRYMDDLIVLSGSKRKLHSDLHKLQRFLRNKLGLELKSNYQVYKLPTKIGGEVFKGRAIDFVGFRFFRYKTIIRKSIYLKMTRLYRRIMNGRYNLRNAYRFSSYNGYITHTNSENIREKYINGKIVAKRLKKFVRAESKRLTEIRQQVFPA